VELVQGGGYAPFHAIRVTQKLKTMSTTAATTRSTVRSAKKLMAAKHRAEGTLNAIGDGVGCTDLKGRITFLNVVAEELTGWGWKEALGRPMAEVIRIVSAATHEPIADLTDRAVEGNETVHLPPDSLLVRRDGIELAVEDSTAPIHDADGNPTGAVIVFRDVSAARAASLQMAYIAQHDFLTGLPNRMLLEDRIGQAINAAPRHAGGLAVMYLDLDAFKPINDELGHPVGDLLLQEVAARLVDCVRASDTVSRQGGDEFVVLLSETNLAEAARVATRMLRAIEDIRVIGGHEIHTTGSLGIALYPKHGGDGDTLIKHADIAMYQAKGNGRSRYLVFDDAMTARVVVQRPMGGPVGVMDRASPKAPRPAARRRKTH
jgi:diguanylate cyclase (GGDEF)-like protein/PAS domain S-box-containing protein